MCGVGVAGVDIDPYGNIQACMHLQESAGNLHQQSIKEIWNNSLLFKRACVVQLPPQSNLSISLRSNMVHLCFVLP